MDNLIEGLVIPTQNAGPIITAIGVGGAGINAVNHMKEIGIEGANLLVCDTDRSSLDNSPVEDKIVMDYVAPDGADSDDTPLAWPDRIRDYLENTGTRMVFIVAGMGGQTGTYASAVIARIARGMGILTVADVASPLTEEGCVRVDTAMDGIGVLRRYADSLMVVDGEKLKEKYGSDLPLNGIFVKADDIMAIAVKSITEVYTMEHAFIRFSFSDIEQIMRDGGDCYIGVASAEGEGRALDAVRRLLRSPLNSNPIAGAKRLLVNISADDIGHVLYDEIADLLQYMLDNTGYTDADGNEHKATIIWGAGSKPALGNALEVVAIATGLDGQPS